MSWNANKLWGPPSQPRRSCQSSCRYVRLLLERSSVKSCQTCMQPCSAAIICLLLSRTRNTILLFSQNVKSQTGNANVQGQLIICAMSSLWWNEDFRRGFGAATEGHCVRPMCREPSGVVSTQCISRTTKAHVEGSGKRQGSTGPAGIWGQPPVRVLMLRGLAPCSCAM